MIRMDNVYITKERYLNGLELKRPEVEREKILVAAVLVLAFSSAIMMRAYPAKYGYFLNEFDPYFDYRATSYIVNHFHEKGLSGLSDYFGWVDKMAWYPEGRRVAQTSQVGLHFFGALLYLFVHDVLLIDTSLYDFLVILPVVIGGLSTLVVFLLVRKMFGEVAGMLSALIFAYSPPLIFRGNLGWFKSEPFGLFFGLLGSYFILRAYESKGIRSLLMAAISGFLFGYANTCWGGSWLFSAVLAGLFILSPFIGVELKKNLPIAAVGVAFTLLASVMLPRPGPDFILTPAGLLLLAGLVFNLIAFGLSRVVKRYALEISLIVTIVIGLASILTIGVGRVDPRYLVVVFPYIRTSNPLVESVAEHFVPTGADYFLSYGILLYLSALGVYVAFKKRSVGTLFALILSIAGIYISASFSRLMVYSSLGFGILGAIGFEELVKRIMAGTVISKKVKVKLEGGTKFICSVALLGLFLVPSVYPQNMSWIASADSPPSIVNGAIPYKVVLNDWREASMWLRENTPEDAVIAAWWDYGYWITVLGNRTSLADNATLNQTRIAQIAKAFMSEEDEGVKILKELHADYVLIFVAGQMVRTRYGTLYLLNGGGDEMKKQWFIRIAGFNESKYLYQDMITPKPYLLEKTLFGKMLPFKLYGYIDRQGMFRGSEYKPGYMAVYSYQLKYPTDSEGPLRLVFMSSSLKTKPSYGSKIFAAVIIYKLVD